jgi:hypothetical protein
VIHGPDIQGAFQGAKATFDILQFFLLLHGFLGTEGVIGGFQQELAVDGQFPLAVLLRRQAQKFRQN